MSFFISDAQAQAAGGAQQSTFSFVLMGAMLVAFYFLLIRPQQKRAKEHQNLLSKLAAGDEVVTSVASSVASPKWAMPSSRSRSPTACASSCRRRRSRSWFRKARTRAPEGAWKIPMLEFARWKYILVACVMVLALVLAAPNFFGEDLAVQVARRDRAPIDAVGQAAVEQVLKVKTVKIKRAYVDEGRLMLLFDEVNQQLAARDAVNDTLSENYVSALARAPRAPAIFGKMGLRPMPLGLDLRGGLSLLYQVDVNGALSNLIGSYDQDFRRALTAANITFSDSSNLQSANGVLSGVRVTFPAGTDLSKARDVMKKVVSDATFTVESSGPVPYVDATLSATQISDRQKNAIQQNMTTLRNRVNELGVTEPKVEQQGTDRISVQLPGVINSAEVKDILGKVATLEFRLTDTQNNVQEAVAKNRAPLGSRLEFHPRGERLPQADAAEARDHRHRRGSRGCDLHHHTARPGRGDPPELQGRRRDAAHHAGQPRQAHGRGADRTDAREVHRERRAEGTRPHPA